ncbi:MAG: cytidylate kinase-like family protein [Eubacteriales bacterium]|jgi:cytidylate kinase|nr:cytidylate kinase-like family protein [Eubacteriales bacterium]MDD3290653.1 cytidylate kinase-like family protein [Eubacteriales bacterium]MDD3863575.1 cytidylate kinase-like family protein [Eubacteriales bacterium]MDD4445741.1 cytidylate kinase-like family protein [Eubacteriales bacterium]
MNQKVITIGREFGSGGREIGIQLAHRLDIPFYDKELLKLASREGEFDEKFLAANEEKAPDLSTPSLGRMAMTAFYQPSLSDTIFIEQSKIIRALAAKGPCVIVGRCADYVLREEGSADIFISASMEYRIKRKRAVAPEKSGYTDEEMEKYIREADKQRMKYYEHYTGRRWGRVENYHLCLFADNVGVQGAVETILTYLEHWK